MSVYALFLALTVAILVVPGVSAQVYKSKDADGNPVFSDTPSEGAEKVEIRQANSANQPVPHAYPEAEDEPAPRAPAVIVVGEQPAMELNEGRRVILDEDEYDRGEASDPRLNVVPRAEVETGLTDDEGREVDPKKDLPRELEVSHPRPRH